MNIAETTQLASQRRAMYRFDSYNPYSHTKGELSLVQENLDRYRAGKISLESFLRMTPHFPRWRDEQLREARVLFITNEPGLGNINRLYAAMSAADTAADIAAHIHDAMLSWLSLTDHPGLGGINGELPWQESGPWQEKFPLLASCGKAGYLMAAGEERVFSGHKMLHLELAPFPQKDGLDVNPRNDQCFDYHEENRATLRKFCALATEDAPRHVFIIGNRARIIRGDDARFRLDALQTTLKDKSRKIVDLLNVIGACAKPVQVRLCRRWPAHGREVNVFTVTTTAAYDLKAVRKGD